MKIYIKQDSENNNALWLVIERSDKKANLNPIMGVFRNEDIENNLAYPLLGDEIEGIKEACEEWLEKHSQEVMKKLNKIFDDPSKLPIEYSEYRIYSASEIVKDLDKLYKKKGKK